MRNVKVAETKERGDAYELVLAVYRKSPGHSWRRLNQALHGALSSAIIGHLSFLPDDFAAIFHDTRSGYWAGNSEGSITGERYYVMAVEAGHIPACISFERYAGRPAALWCETAKTPERLCIGKRLSWKGATLKVSNQREDHLIACGYTWVEQPEFGQGSTVYADGCRCEVEGITRMEDGKILLTLGVPKVETSRKPTSVTRISYAELAASRKASDSARRKALGEISAASDREALAEVEKRLLANRRDYRSFDWKDFREAIARWEPPKSDEAVR
jgi:hypothetical protein